VLPVFSPKMFIYSIFFHVEIFLIFYSHGISFFMTSGFANSLRSQLGGLADWWSDSNDRAPA
jgi:hypothetical protein